MEYKVTWTIELDAESPEDAAKKTLKIQRDNESLATHFVVQDKDGKEQEVDLLQDNEVLPISRIQGEKNMTIHVTVEVHQGVIAKVRVFRNEVSAGSAEKEWLRQMSIQDEIGRQCKSDDGTEFLIFQTKLEP